MSYRRAQRRAINRNTLLDNRLTNFTNPPIHVGDLYIERNEFVGGNLTVSGDLSTVNFYSSGNYYLDNYVLIPPGTVIQSASMSQPDGWFDCDGRDLSASTYPGLFTAIGYTYGGSSGTFRLPDMRGRVVVCQDGSSWNLGATGGEQAHTLIVEEIPAHTHSVMRRSNPDSGAFDTGDTHKFESSAITSDRADLGDFYTQSAGGGQAHNNMQPYLVLRYLIKY
jgi:microcystin-dependent protein